MTDLAIVSTFPLLLQSLSCCFTAPSHQSFVMLMSGWILNLGRHTVTGSVRAAGAVGHKHISSFHRFFSQGRWHTDEVGLTLAHLVITKLLNKDAPIRVIVDDTLGRHTGKRIAAASMHRDPLLSTARRPIFHWGHVWVVMAIEVELFERRWALPVLMRLHRSKKRCSKEGYRYIKTTEHARELMLLLAGEYPDRTFWLIGDGAYTNSVLIKDRPCNVEVFGRGRLDAAIYAPPPKRKKGQRGRPRVRGRRLACPQKRANSSRAPWEQFEIEVYGKTCIVNVLVIDALWYIVSGSESIRHVVVRGFPGHEHDDVFVCTDSEISPQQVIETYARRWAIEVTFHEAKSKLGFEDPQNRTSHAVERTAPMSLFAHSLIVLWYARVGHRTRFAKSQSLPWYPHKPSVTFSDMLATIRRASWAERLLDPTANAANLRKRIRPLVDYFSSAA
jgi:DDE superfamily endonuclease